MERHKVKNDELTLIRACQFIREGFRRWDVIREPFLFFNNDGSFHRWSTMVLDVSMKFRHPDIMVLDGDDIRFVMEIDGAIHDSKVAATEARNGDYAAAGIPLEIVSLAETDDMYATIAGICSRYYVKD